MLSLFVRAENHLPGAPAPQPVADKNTALPNSEQATNPTEMVHDAIANGETGDLSGLLSVIIANAEFLEVIYGDNQYLKNIINAADKAKTQFLTSGSRI